jgi:hypothetical protein
MHGTSPPAGAVGFGPFLRGADHLRRCPVEETAEMALPRDVANRGARPKTIADQQQVGELQLAWGHAMWRNNLVAKVFCYLGVMRAADAVPAGSRAVVSPSNLPVPQDYNASGGNQAAHYLPGFLAIATPQALPRPLWQFASDSRVQGQIQDLFRATQDLPAGYNRADSAAEEQGLKALFADCCQLILDARPPASRLSKEVFIIVDRPFVFSVFRRWAEASVDIYRAAAARKSTAMKLKRPGNVSDAPISDPAKGIHNQWTAGAIAARVNDLGRTVHGRKGSVQDFADQESFLRAYANVCKAGFPLSDTLIQEIEAPFSAHKRLPGLIR